MNLLHFKKITAYAVMTSIASLSTVYPFAHAQAAAICDASDPTTAAGQNPACNVVRFPSGPYAYPKLNWELLGEVTTNAGQRASSESLANRILADNNRTAAALGVTADKVAEAITLLPSNGTVVFARANPAAAELRIDIFKVEKTASSISMRRAPFGPAHGGAWAASLKYSSQGDKQLAMGPGRNPFAMFHVAGDDTFHNIVGQNAIQVAVGHAMRASGATVALVAVPDVRVHQYVKKSGNAFRKKITTHVVGYTKPRWYIATPQAFQPHAEKFSMCMDNVSNPVDCPATSVVPSNISWIPWKGGNLPSAEDETSHWTKTKKGYTFLTYVLVLGAIDIASFAYNGMGSGQVAVGTAGVLSGTASGGSTGTAPVGSIGGVGGSTALNASQSGAAVTELVGAVGGYSGQPSTGTFEGADDGYGAPMSGSSSAEQSVLNGVHAKFDTATIEGSGVRAVAQGAFGANCAPGALHKSCAGGSGVVPRPDTYTEFKTVDFWDDNGLPLRDSVIPTR